MIPSKPVLIGVTGRARSGKDTLGAYLETFYQFERYAFAWPLKHGIRSMFGLDSRHTDGELKETPLEILGGRSPRQVMQTLGTEWGRTHVAPDIWVDLGVAKWLENRDAGRSLVITDVRFENEAQAIRGEGGVVIHVTRKAADAVTPHASEKGVQVEGMDITLANDGELADFYEAIEFEVMPLLYPVASLDLIRSRNAASLEAGQALTTAWQNRGDL